MWHRASEVSDSPGGIRSIYIHLGTCLDSDSHIPGHCPKFRAGLLTVMVVETSSHTGEATDENGSVLYTCH